jgi:hypothetical protein
MRHQVVLQRARDKAGDVLAAVRELGPPLLVGLQPRAVLGDRAARLATTPLPGLSSTLR